MYAYSTDGTTVERIRRNPGTSRDLATGDWVALGDHADDADRARCGWYPITEVPRPDADHIRTITNTGAGLFTETWTFDQATADANAADADRETDRVALRDQPLPLLDVTGLNAAQFRTAMVDAHNDLVRAVRRMRRAQRLDE